MLVHENRVKSNLSAFVAKVKTISAALGANPNWFMQLFLSESGLDHRIENTSYPFKNGLATGLIQFTPDTAIGLGTTVAKLKAMTNVEQLDWVYKYFKPYTGRIKSYYDLYFINFFPLAVGKPDDWVFQAKNIAADKIAISNPGFDLNHDHKLTVAEVKQAMFQKVKKDISEAYLADFNTVAKKKD